MFHLKNYHNDVEVDVDDNSNTAEATNLSTSGRPSKLPRRGDATFRGDASVSKSRQLPSSPTGSPGITREELSAEVEAKNAEALSRTRGTTACQRCRSRKTKCDARRPSCSNCAKIRVQCLYDSESSSSCQIFGPQVLEAISDLSALVQRQHAEQQSYNRSQQKGGDALSTNTITSPLSAQSPLAQISLGQKQNAQRRRSDVMPFSGPEIGVNEQRAIKRQRPIQAQGVESVLNWKVYSGSVNTINLFGEAKFDLTANHNLPSLEYLELARLESKYVAAVHMMNPILDLSTLHQKMLYVSENGLDWSTRTCLVTLVCAIGAIAGRYKNIYYSTPNSVPILAAPEDEEADAGESEIRLATQYWNVAVKRLGYASGQDDLEAVQCLCLAGIWYMNIFQPLQAWKYFSLAGNAWYAATLKGIHSRSTGTVVTQANSLSLEQSLYFTIYKSECELRVELDLPGSALEDIDLSQTFPLPPTLDGYLSDIELDVTERGWYYYLAEIAARHLINRMLRVRFWTQAVVNNEEILRMLADVELFETQLCEWHTSLPLIFKFDIPRGVFAPPDPDGLKQILRHRYLTTRELIYRPFVRLCVEHKLDYLEAHLRAAVTTLANSGLQYCVYKLSQFMPLRHQGTWFMIRTFATCSMILLAVKKARNDLSFLGAASITMPDNWRTQIVQTMHDIGPCWDDGPGGVGEIRRLVEWTLATES